MPTTPTEVLAFYKKAVDKVRTGACGYDKQAWQTVPALNITGNAGIDNTIKGLVGNYMTPKDKAEVEKYTKNTDGAKTHLPPCNLTDMSKIKSATCTQQGGNYLVKIVLADETSPATKQASFLNQITDNFLAKDSIDETLNGISIVKNANYDLVYKDYTITAVITPDGNFQSLLHHSSVDIQIHSVNIILPIKDKGATMEADCEWRNFSY